MPFGVNKLYPRGEALDLMRMVVPQVKAKPGIARPDDPVGFFRDVLGWDAWSLQRDIAESVRDRRYSFVKKCHASGGTALMARIALWYLYSFSPSIVLTTAPTDRQVTQLLWRELRTAFRKSKRPLPGRLYEIPQLNRSDESYALGFSTDNPDNVPGFHSENVLVLKDEAPGMAPAVENALESAMAGGKQVRQLSMGQPVRAAGSFYDAYNRNRGLYAGGLFTIRAEDTPNFTGEAYVPGLISQEWEGERRRVWGPDSILYNVRVLANFPSLGTYQLISPEWCDAAALRALESVSGGPRVLGCDVAGLGRNESVIYPRQGDRLFAPTVLAQHDPMAVVGRIIQIAKLWRAVAIAVDVVGMGAGIVARLREVMETALPRCRVIVPVNAGGKAWMPRRYANRGSELYGVLANKLREGEIAGALDDDTIGNLTQVIVKPTSNGSLIIDKHGEKALKQYQANDTESPDRGDALAYSEAALAAIAKMEYSAEGERA